MKSLFWKLDKVGRIRLSEHFYFRQFLYSEIGISYGIPNIPDNLDLAVETGTTLCKDILEPIVRSFGPIVIRSGFRSAELNDFGYRNRLMCSSNEKNYAYHIWDHLSVDGCKGASACIVVPGIELRKTELETRQGFASWIDENLPYNAATFFKRDHALNIGWHECPARSIYNSTTSTYLIKK